MRVLFHLSIRCITEENIWEEYSIGLFKSLEDVDMARKKLMGDGGRFSKRDSEARVSEVEVIGEGIDSECVYRFYGQNVEIGVEGDTIESSCYLDKATAIQEFMKAKRQTPRQQWSLETHVIGKCNW